MPDTDTDAMTPKDKLALLKKHGLLARKNNLKQPDLDLLSSLSEDEIEMLARIRSKLGQKLLDRGAKGGKFPHPDSSSF